MWADFKWEQWVAETWDNDRLVADFQQRFARSRDQNIAWVEARGHHCPVPSLRLARCLRTLETGAVVVLAASDPMARIDIPHMLTDLSHEILALETRARPRGPEIFFVIRA